MSLYLVSSTWKVAYSDWPGIYKLSGYDAGPGIVDQGLMAVPELQPTHLLVSTSHGGTSQDFITWMEVPLGEKHPGGLPELRKQLRYSPWRVEAKHREVGDVVPQDFVGCWSQGVFLCNIQVSD